MSSTAFVAGAALSQGRAQIDRSIQWKEIERDRKRGKQGNENDRKQRNEERKKGMKKERKKERKEYRKKCRSKKERKKEFVAGAALFVEMFRKVGFR